jgi:hypothetical protein
LRPHVLAAYTCFESASPAKSATAVFTVRTADAYMTVGLHAPRKTRVKSTVYGSFPPKISLHVVAVLVDAEPGLIAAESSGSASVL